MTQDAKESLVYYWRHRGEIEDSGTFDEKVDKKMRSELKKVYGLTEKEIDKFK